MSRRVLIVDDEGMSVVGSRIELQKRGFAVDEVNSERQARCRLAGTPYDAVLLDLMLPEEAPDEPKSDPPRAERGEAVFRGIRAGEFARTGGTAADAAVFVITALGIEAQGALDRCQELSPGEVFRKPVRPALVAEVIRAALEEGT